MVYLYILKNIEEFRWNKIVDFFHLEISLISLFEPKEKSYFSPQGIRRPLEPRKQIQLGYLPTAKWIIAL